MMRLVTVTTLLLVGSGTVLVGGPALAADPTTLECLISYEDSVTLKNRHALTAARARLLICSSTACPADIRNECVARGHAIDAAIPTIIFAFKDATGAALADVTVTMDGELLAEPLQGNALSVDPGAHTFTFDVAGRPKVEKPLMILEGQKERREAVVFEAAMTATPVPAPRLPPRATSDSLGASGHVETALLATPPTTKERRSSPVYTRWWFWTTLAVVAAGGVATALLLSSGSDAPPAPPFGTKAAGAPQ
jgi:hypothetical protein